MSPPSDFLSGISSLINASRTSTTKILWQMRKQEREDMDSHLAIRKGARSPITPVEGTTSGSASLEAHAGASASGDGAANVPLRIKTKPSNPFPPILPFDSFWSVSLPFDTDLALYDGEQTNSARDMPEVRGFFRLLTSPFLLVLQTMSASMVVSVSSASWRTSTPSPATWPTST